MMMMTIELPMIGVVGKLDKEELYAVTWRMGLLLRRRMYGSQFELARPLEVEPIHVYPDVRAPTKLVESSLH